MLLARSWAGGGQCSFVPQPCYDPMTMLMVGATAAGTGLSAYGTIAGGKSDQQAADYRAQQLRQQAELTRQQADETRAAGKMELAGAQVDAAELKRRKELALSTQQARAAAGGFTATDPTALALADEVERYGTLQERMAVFGGTYARAQRNAQARGQEMDAGNLDTQAAYENWQGKVAKKASYLKAATTILGGVSGIAGKFNPSASFASQDDYRYGSKNLIDRNHRFGTTSTYRSYG